MQGLFLAIQKLDIKLLKLNLSNAAVLIAVGCVFITKI